MNTIKQTAHSGSRTMTDQVSPALQKPLRTPSEALRDALDTGETWLVFIDTTEVHALYSRAQAITYIAEGQFPSVMRVVWLSGGRYSDQSLSMANAVCSHCLMCGYDIPEFVIETLSIEHVEGLKVEHEADIENEGQDNG